MDDIMELGKSLYGNTMYSASDKTENNTSLERSDRREERSILYSNELDGHTSSIESINLQNSSLSLESENENITISNDSSNISEVSYEDKSIEVNQERPKRRWRKTEEEEDDDYEGDILPSKKRIVYRNRLFVCYKHISYTQYIILL